MNDQQATRAAEAEVMAESAEQREGNQTSNGNNLALSIVLFIVLFALFAGGLYVMSLFTAVTFVVGLGMCLLALLGTFDLVPRFLT
ncbi:hypothetical protein [Brachybacterium sp. FME24]|uniref:hypothetical protein n=1 Tax=Brachybacterium sp. FME24 TaxID=2742605 RepID=UPI001D04A26D|nr:hypothetical protein [Brachybacterium sp. FME24]